jgi:hypothetical protein
MDFRLIYEGPLKANRGSKDKQGIRRVFHKQLVDLLSRPAYADFRRTLEMTEIRLQPPRIRGFLPRCLISKSTQHVALLDILILYREEPGRGVTQAGDLDNRVKTLLDALRAPQNDNEIPTGDAPDPTEEPFCCLLEDDSLIRGLSITADRLLKPTSSVSDVVTVIRVTPEPTFPTLGTGPWVP